jgi:2-oxoglutarate ferredoxin oxidoreductase subunit beta
MRADVFDMGPIDIAWCPGCGNFAILKALKEALAELEIMPKNLVMVSGIGQAAKIPHYLRSNVFNGLHGRALPPSTAIKAVNPALTVIAESGDGDMYGEGGNHLLNAMRRNPDITNIVHNNMVYGLTKGQASPTSRMGFKTPVQVRGVKIEPFNPIALAVAMDASFVARAFAGDAGKMKEIIKKGISHRGYALIDILQPCVSFNKFNTYEWFKANTYYLGDGHDPKDRQAAFAIASEEGKMALGVIYENSDRPCFEETTTLRNDELGPVYRRKPGLKELAKLVDSKRGCSKKVMNP